MNKKSPDFAEEDYLREQREHFFRELEVEFLIHELKDPISVAETGLRTLLERKEKFGELSPKQEKTLGRVLRNTVKAREMLYSLLEIGRTQAGFINCTHFNPAQIAYETLLDSLEIVSHSICERVAMCVERESALALLSDNGVVLNIQEALMESEVYLDEVKFRQILGNLIKNALHHKKERVEIKGLVDQNRFIMEVSDDGPGIDPRHHQMVFQRYTRMEENSKKPLRRKGHGLGLAGARILARSLGGNILISSNPGTGATFKLDLPLVLSGANRSEHV